MGVKENMKASFAVSLAKKVPRREMGGKGRDQGRSIVLEWKGLDVLRLAGGGAVSREKG